ncbi:MAG: hypothetical protein EA397_10005 [Deltaproteobacteria bacterium]|nr:MAG: hypothetical protein EA397_10005 [Deltaproteobacteria bacterium]
MTRLTVPLLLLLGLPALASLPDDDFDWDEDETEEERKEREEAEKKRLSDGDDLDVLDDEDELDGLEPVEDTGEDLLGGTAPEDRITAEGQDTSRIYRDAAEEYSNYSADEEMLAWERYLREYPNAIYKERIERRLEELEEQLYRGRRAPQTETRLDGDQRDVPISQPLLLENINPTNRILAGVEYGPPNYINLMLDYEHALSREFSVHGGIRNRFMVWNLETGVRYALIKSSRTNTLVTGIADVRLALNPAYLAFRPQVGAGKMIGIFDIQAQGGVDLEARAGSSVRLIGGINVTGRIDENVAVFAETNYNAKNLTWDQGGAFQFPVASLGFKFYPPVANQPKGFVEVNVGGSIPYATRYYRWHEVSVMAQLNVYPSW